MIFYGISSQNDLRNLHNIRRYFYKSRKTQRFSAYSDPINMQNVSSFEPEKKSQFSYECNHGHKLQESSIYTLKKTELVTSVVSEILRYFVSDGKLNCFPMLTCGVT